MDSSPSFCYLVGPLWFSHTVEGSHCIIDTCFLTCVVPRYFHMLRLLPLMLPEPHKYVGSILVDSVYNYSLTWYLSSGFVFGLWFVHVSQLSLDQRHDYQVFAYAYNWVPHKNKKTVSTHCDRLLLCSVGLFLSYQLRPLSCYLRISSSATPHIPYLLCCETFVDISYTTTV